MIRLSPRLESIALLVTPGSRVADIGTDHAYLPVWLCQKDIAPSAIAADLRPGPLRAAFANIQSAGLADRIRVRQSDGLSAFSPGEADTLVLAGMGGKLICQILERGTPILSGFREMLLQPQSDIREVRCLIEKLQWHIEDETCTVDEDKFYPVIRAVKGNAPFCSEIELSYGPCLLKEKNRLLEHWLRKRLALTEKIRNELNTREGDAVFRRLTELKEEEQLLKEALNCYEM